MSEIEFSTLAELFPYLWTGLLRDVEGPKGGQMYLVSRERQFIAIPLF